MLRTFFCALCVCGIAFSNNICAATAEPRAVDIVDLVEVRSPSKVAISPDGEHVAYFLNSPALKDNTITTELYVVATDGQSGPRRLMSAGSESSFYESMFKQALTWTPDSQSLVFVAPHEDGSEVRAIEVTSGKLSVLVAQNMLEDGYEIQGADGATFKFSPDGSRLAFVAKRSPVDPLPHPEQMHAFDGDEDWQPPAKRGQPDWVQIMNLFMLDLNDKRVTRLTGDEYDVASFDWSPDGKQLALSLKTDLSRLTSYYTTDLFVLDIESGALRPLVRQEGRDDDPLWSPDGQTIAFVSQAGQENGANTTTLALIAADGDTPPRYLGREQLDHWVSSSVPVRWSPDGSMLDVRAFYDMARHMLRVDIRSGKVSRLTPRADRYYFGEDAVIAYSSDGRTAFTVEGVGVPREVAVADANFRDVRQLTRLNPELESVSVPKVERIRWRSPDDKWYLNGLLLKPSNYQEGRRYPMLTMLQGGPTMVFQFFNPSFNYPLPVLAERGYVIFIPNTRGRPGYGVDFHHAIRDEKSYVLNPLKDVLSGIDMLVERGVADPERLGVMGFSYGGTLTANIVAHTDRFKAALYGEGTPDILGNGLQVSRGFQTLYRDMRGLGVAFEPEVIQVAMAESAIYRLDQVRTPVMIETGERSKVDTDRIFFRGLKYFGIPAVWRIYPRSGHGWDEPRLVKDAYEHHVAWWDYWLLDKPYPDVDRQAEFDAWRSHRTP